MHTFLHNHNYFYESQKVFGKNCNTTGSQKMLTRVIATWQRIEKVRRVNTRYLRYQMILENEFYYACIVSDKIYRLFET